MRFRWSTTPGNALLASQLGRQLGLSPLLAQCLVNRGFSDPSAIAQFLEPRLRQLSDLFLIPNMGTAVERLFQARERAERVVLFGDYDVDGVTSTALLIEVLRPLGWNVDAYLPHRRDEGYGLSADGVENCLARYPASLLVAVDCGSSAPEAIAKLRQRGVDVIVLDHHQISQPAPNCVALVNPLVAGSPAHGTELCSAGLAFKLAHALVKRGREMGVSGAGTFDLRRLLDFVALGTVADLVPLRGENRILVAAGLDRISRGSRPGLSALKQVARAPEVLGTFEVGFQLAPRLNAAGRLETAQEALELLLADDHEAALKIAQALDARNRERQTIERSIALEAVDTIRAKFKPDQDFVIVEGQSPWHIGVVGIVASRVLRQFYRPTIIVGGDGDHWRGSGRSIAGFDLAAALRECGDLLARHGGHAMAAGVSIVPDRLPAFRERLNQIARRTLTLDALQEALAPDAETGLDEMTPGFLAQAARLRPIGQGNPQVQFQSCGLTHARPLVRIGAERQHVKMWVTDGAATHEAIWWNAGAESLPVGKFDLAFSPQLNTYNGNTAVQLKVLDWRPASH